MKIVYKITWHFNTSSIDNRDLFVKCTVDPVTVLNLDGNALTGKNSAGRKFQGSTIDYYETEEEAWAEIKRLIIAGIKTTRVDVDLTTQNLHKMEEFLETLK
jgi:hypothetical protein